MCKLWNCHDNDCYDCKRKAERAKKKLLKRTPLKKKVYKIKHRSNKRAKQEREYSKEVKPWKLEHDRCKARLTGCTGRTEHCHHMKGKEGELILIKKYWLPVCGNCHDIIGKMGIEEAIEKGLSLRRNVEISQRIK